ncbi:MAG: hypothetical protein HFG91_05675 [Acholeplasmatales bacterium]|jgi:hypothetical protein|nr:hypothetical protein [Acholeplasmatales bacterium]
MKRRTTLLKTLKLNVTSNLQPLVLELQEEIKDYFIKMDLYFHFNKNTILFKSIYIENKTYLEISQDLPLNFKSIAKFVKDTEDFTISLIVKFEKYSKLFFYIENKI